MTERRYVLGIDLGTTNTVCAVWYEGDERPEVAFIRQPYSSPTDEAELESLPSVVAFTQDSGIQVGHYAKEVYGRANRDRAVSSVKRHMGTRWSKRIDGKDVHPEEVSACILRAVWDGWTGRPPSRDPELVVITVPACFGTEQRHATRGTHKAHSFRCGL